MFLAPMDGYTDAAFRKLCQRLGAEYAYTELISAVGYAAGVPVTVSKSFVPKDDRSGLQFFGADPKAFRPAVEKLEDDIANGITFPKSIDLNMGCPMRNVMRMGAGAALLKTPSKVDSILTEMEKSSLPVSVKMRIGIASKNGWKKFVPVLNRHGLQHITVHARTQEEKYMGKGHWELTKDIASSFKHPVVINGNVNCEEDAERLIKSGAANVMVGRAALTNPFIFRSTGENRNTNRSANKNAGMNTNMNISMNTYANAKKTIELYKKLAKKYKCEDDVQLLRIKMKLFSGFEGAKEIRKHVHERDE